MAGFWKVGFSNDRVEETQGDMKRRKGPWMYSLKHRRKKDNKKYFIFVYI